MRDNLCYKENLNEKIEITRELLHKKIEKGASKGEIQRISETLDKLIVDYFK